MMKPHIKIFWMPLNGKTKFDSIPVRVPVLWCEWLCRWRNMIFGNILYRRSKSSFLCNLYTVHHFLDDEINWDERTLCLSARADLELTIKFVLHGCRYEKKHLVPREANYLYAQARSRLQFSNENCAIYSTVTIRKSGEISHTTSSTS